MNKIPLTREEDIENRGKDCLVYDYDGNITILEKSQIWYSHDGNYMEPRDYHKKCFCIF